MSSTSASALSQQTTISASTAETTIVAADPNFRNLLTGLVITTPNIQAGTLTLRDATGGATRLVVDYPNAAAAPGAPLVLSFNPPLQPSANNNTAWTLQASLNASSYKVVAAFVEG
jgi:hypothetical protein